MQTVMVRRAVVGLVGVALALGGLSACADDANDAPPASGATSSSQTGAAATVPPSSPPPNVELFAFEIADGQASPPLDRATVDRGATVRIVVTSDQPDEVHLHGYDLTAQVEPGQQGVIEFVADQTGLFELETHETRLVLLQLQVQ